MLERQEAAAGAQRNSANGRKRRSADAVDVSVLIPTLNEADHVRETVAAIRRQRGAGTVELLFIDGLSEDRTRVILQEMAAGDDLIRVLENPKRRTPNALNVGLSVARGEYIARMDAHAVHSPDYLALGIKRLCRGDVDQVAGPAIPQGTSTWSRRVALALDCKLGTFGSRKWRSAGSEEPEPEEERELDTGVYAGVWRRETLERLGGWDEGWPINQDSQLAARILEAGGRIVLLPRMAATYIPRSSVSGLARQYWHYGRYRAKTAYYHPVSLRRSHLLAPGVVLCAAASVAPHRAALIPRVVVASYLAVVASAGAATIRRAPWRDAASVPLLLTVMHVTWGAGFLYGGVRHGPPLLALLRLARLRPR
jgi:succinoglycan biosynthesis protein ExoA